MWNQERVKRLSHFKICIGDDILTIFFGYMFLGLVLVYSYWELERLWQSSFDSASAAHDGLCTRYQCCRNMKHALANCFWLFLPGRVSGVYCFPSAGEGGGSARFAPKCATKLQPKPAEGENDQQLIAARFVRTNIYRFSGCGPRGHPAKSSSTVLSRLG